MGGEGEARERGGGSEGEASQSSGRIAKGRGRGSCRDRDRGRGKGRGRGAGGQRKHAHGQRHEWTVAHPHTLSLYGHRPTLTHCLQGSRRHLSPARLGADAEAAKRQRLSRCAAWSEEGWCRGLEVRGH